MTLSYSEEVRLSELESIIAELQILIKKAASEEMLNRLLTLCSEENRKTRAVVAELETKADEIIALGQKLQ